MDIVIRESKIQFKNPQIGQPTRAIEEHYNGRRFLANVDGEERMFRFKKDELPFDVDEEGMIQAIENRLSE